MKIIELENSQCIQVQLKWDSYRIFQQKNYFKIQQVFLGIILKEIAINFDSFIKDDHNCFFYLKNKHQRVSVIFTEDLEVDFIQFSMDYGDQITISSNRKAKEIFDKLLGNIVFFQCG